MDVPDKDDAASTEVARLQVSDTVYLSFAPSRFNGPRSGSIRTYVVSKKYAGPTPKGIDVDLDVLIALLSALREHGTTLDTYLQGPLPRELARIAKNATSSIVVSLIPDDRRPELTHLDIRTFVQTEKYTGWTKKGFRLVVDRLDELTNATEILVDALRRNLT